MKMLDRAYVDLKKKYDMGQTVTDGIFDTSIHCMQLLKKNCTPIDYGFDNNKKYFVFSDEGRLSRPINKALYILDEKEFSCLWDKFFLAINKNRVNAAPDLIDRVVYTTTISFCCCYDIWKVASRKTPGTYFEIFLGSLLSLLLPAMERSKFIQLPDIDTKLSTDIFFKGKNGGLVIPAKITTRERIVQPYAHQRILDSIFGIEKYRSLLLCVSETRRNDQTLMVNDICVPGPIKLYQQHLSNLAGIYYMDPPVRYLQEDVKSIVDVGYFSSLLRSKLAEIVTPML